MFPPKARSRKEVDGFAERVPQGMCWKRPRTFLVYDCSTQLNMASLAIDGPIFHRTGILTFFWEFSREEKFNQFFSVFPSTIGTLINVPVH